MEHVVSFNLFGTEVKQIPCVIGKGAPTKETIGAVGCLYMNTDNGAMYKCTAVADGVYTWVAFGSGGGGSGGITEEELDSRLEEYATTSYVDEVTDKCVFYGDMEGVLTDHMEFITQSVIAALPVYGGELA